MGPKATMWPKIMRMNHLVALFVSPSICMSAQGQQTDANFEH